MTKVVIIADSHLVHKYHPAFDKTKEFDRFIDQVLKENPAAIIALGDVIDEKYTDQGHPISYPDGARIQFPVVDTIKRTGMDWYVLLGNHDDPAVFKIIEQATGMLKVYTTDPVAMIQEKPASEQIPLVIDQVAFWFAPLSYKWTEERKMELLRQYFEVKARYKKAKKHVLLLHCDIIRRAPLLGFSKESLEQITKNFNVVLCGHEHEYGPVESLSTFLCVPATFPTGVKKNSNPARKYKYDDHKLEVTQDWAEPFGYLLFDTESLACDKKTFHPSACTVEVEYNVSGKDMIAIKQEWQTILSRISADAINTGQYSTVLVMPVISGTMERLMKVTVEKDLQDVGEKYEGIYVVEPRYGEIDVKSNSFEDFERLPEVSLDAVVTRTTQQTGAIQKKLKDLGIKMSQKGIIHAIQVMTNREEEFFQKKGTHKEITLKLVKQMSDFMKEEFDIVFDENELNRVITDGMDKR